MDDGKLAAANKQPLTLAVKTNSVEALGQRDAGNDRLLLEVDNDDLVIAVTGMEHRRPRLCRMEGDVYGEIPQGDLFACRPQRPLRGQQDFAAYLLARQSARVDGRLVPTF